MTDKILWVVRIGNAHFITFATNREQAKNNAQHWFGGDPDKYTVTPLTNVGDRIHIDITLQI